MLHRTDRPRCLLWVAGAVGYEDGVRFVFLNLRRPRLRRDDDDIKPPAGHGIEDVLLDPQVDHHHLGPLPGDPIGSAAGDGGDQIEARDLRLISCDGDDVLSSHLRPLPYGEGRLHGSLISYLDGEHPRVQARDSGHPLLLQKLRYRPRRPVVKGPIPDLPADHRRRADPVRLEVVAAHPVVSHEGIGEHQKLSPVGGIGHSLLIAGDHRYENQLARDDPRGAEAHPFDSGAVLQP